MMSKMLSGIKFRSKFTVNNTTYGKIYNCYLWEKNKGYGTKDHLLAIKKYGKTRIHRYTYKIK